MKKLLALVLSMLLVASCFALIAAATDETTEAAGDATTEAAGDATTEAAGEATTEAAGDDATTEAAGDATTEEAPAPTYSGTLLVFNSDVKKVFKAPNGIKTPYYKSDWEGARLKITNTSDPFVTIDWNAYKNIGDFEDVDSQSYPFVVLKIKVVGYVDDIRLYYCAGEITAAAESHTTPSDYPCSSSGDVEFIMYDLTGDCEGKYNAFRVDPEGVDEDTEIYLYELALFATEEEAYAYVDAGTEDKPSEDDVTTEAADDATTEETTEETTKAPAKTEATTEADKEGGCGSIISVGTVIAVISLGVVCIKKKD